MAPVLKAGVIRSGKHSNYDVSGLTSFIVNHNGIVYVERDSGPNAARPGSNFAKATPARGLF
jgi:hypothetical protein